MPSPRAARIFSFGVAVGVILATAMTAPPEARAAPDDGDAGNADAGDGGASSDAGDAGDPGDPGDGGTSGRKPGRRRASRPPRPPPPRACPQGMVEIAGEYCPQVLQPCLAWLPPEQKGAPMRCARFAPTRPCAVDTVKRRFCIDRLEYPNLPGARPVVMKTWGEADVICRRRGKRLCKDSEWTLACEGPARLPYPYGTSRDPEACNIDRRHMSVDEPAIRNPVTRAKEVSRLWQGEPSGTRRRCVSPYGVLDMTGNVDEWVENESGKPFRSGLKGGYWGQVRNGCRPMTTAHGESFPFYQTGFRCCADAREVPSTGDEAPEDEMEAL